MVKMKQIHRLRFSVSFATQREKNIIETLPLLVVQIRWLISLLRRLSIIKKKYGTKGETETKLAMMLFNFVSNPKRKKIIENFALLAVKISLL